MHHIVAEDCEYIIRALGAGVEKFLGKTVLITGFSGFIGTYLTNVLRAANKGVLAKNPCKILCLDNFSRGRPQWVEDVHGDPQCEIIDHNIADSLPASLRERGIHYIIHAASIASPTYYRLHPIETMDANVTGLRHLLEYAKGHKAVFESFLFFSSSEIYGDPVPESIPTPETYNGNVSSIGPRACYDESKRYGETLCVNFFRAHGVPVKIVRPFNNYGPGLKITDGRAIPDFFRNVLAGNDITLFSDGSPTRTFCYIADAVVGYLKVLLSPYHGEAFNIGSDGSEISVAELAVAVQKVAGEALGQRVAVRHAASDDPHYLTDNPSRRCPSIEKARSLLEYEPEIALEEGLRRTALWYKDHPTGSYA